MSKIGTTFMAVVIAMLPFVQGHAECTMSGVCVIDAIQTVASDDKDNPDHFHREVFYDIRRSDNDPANTVMKEVAEFMNSHPNTIVSIVGYADKGTGNYSLNQMYARSRAEQFKSDLITRYGIDARRISTDYKGDTVQPFSRNDMNRCVIIDAYLPGKAGREKDVVIEKDGERPIVIHNATIISQAEREKYLQEKEQRYNAERRRRSKTPSRVDTIYVSRTDTLWLGQSPDTLKAERPFGLNKKNRLNNWFITLEGGPSIFQGDHNVDAVWKDRLYPAFNASIGKWIVPALGFRAAVDLDMVHSYYNANPNSPNPLAYKDGTVYYGEFVHGASPNEPYEKAPWLYRMRYNTWNFHGDLMVNLSSLIWRPYNRRIWNLIPYVGLGCIVTWDNGAHDWFNYGLCWNLGVINSFRVSEHFDINLDIRVKKFPDDFNCFRQGHSREGITNVMIGATWHFTERGF